MAEEKPKKKQGPGKRRMNIAFYEALLEAYREFPGNHSAAGRRVGCDKNTAKRGWDNGWKKYDWAPPISEVIANEHEIARARIEQDAEAEAIREELINPEGGIAEVAAERRDAHLDAQRDRALARENAIKTRVEQGQMIDGLRKLTMQCEAIIGKRYPGAIALADRINKEMLRMAKLSRKDFVLSTAQQALRIHNTDVRSISAAVKRVVEVEALHLGEPTQIIGVQTTNFDDADEETLKREIQKALEAFEEDDTQGMVNEAANGAANGSGGSEPIH